MNESNTEEILTVFLEHVEQLIDRYQTLESELHEWKNRTEKLKDIVEELEDKNQEISEKIDKQRLNFNELAGSLESRLNQIKKEASQLLPEHNP